MIRIFLSTAFNLVGTVLFIFLLLSIFMALFKNRNDKKRYIDPETYYLIEHRLFEITMIVFILWLPLVVAAFVLRL